MHTTRRITLGKADMRHLMEGGTLTLTLSDNLKAEISMANLSIGQLAAPLRERVEGTAITRLGELREAGIE